MSQHSRSVFYNSCLKLPRNPISAHPLPRFEQEYLNSIKNKIESLNLKDEDLENSDGIKSSTYKKVAYVPRDIDLFKSLAHFFNSIPDYNDVHHLSNHEFHRRIKNLKQKQKYYFNYMETQQANVNKWMKEYRNLKENQDVLLNTASKLVNERDKNSLDFSGNDLEILTGNSLNYCENFKLRLNETKSEPTTPKRQRRTSFNKDEDFLENSLQEKDLFTRKSIDKEHLFKTHPIPIESQIPLFDKIMLDQELKNQTVRERSKARLMSKMRPFSFTKRDEELQSLSRELSKSTPNLSQDDINLKVKPFRAKPVPKHIFSNYIYKKMHEDEYYRSIQKRVRAEEMLKTASLPPSMAKREKYEQKYTICPRSYRKLQSPRISPTHLKCSPYEDFNNYCKNFWLLRSHHRKSGKKFRKGFKQSPQKYVSSSAPLSRSSTNLSASLAPVNRSNMAAVLRIESAQQKLHDKVQEQMQEEVWQQNARVREKRMRKKPVWYHLDSSHAEDLEMRLELRREEERLRNEAHRLTMELMLNRVNRLPTLYERQSHT